MLCMAMHAVQGIGNIQYVMTLQAFSYEPGMSFSPRRQKGMSCAMPCHAMRDCLFVQD